MNLINIRRACFTQQKEWGLYQNKVNSSLAVIQRPGHQADYCKMVYWPIRIQQAGKKSSVLTSSKQVIKGFEIRQLFSLEMALNIREKGFTILKPIPVCKKWKIWTILCFQASILAPKMGRRRSAWQLARCSSSRWDRSCVILTKVCYSS